MKPKPKAPAAYSLETTLTALDPDGGEHEIDVTIWFNAIYTKGRTYGPPDDCYPDDSEFEIVQVDVDDYDLPYGISKADIEKIIEDDDGGIESDCWEEYMKCREEDSE